MKWFHPPFRLPGGTSPSYHDIALNFMGITPLSPEAEREVTVSSHLQRKLSMHDRHLIECNLTLRDLNPRSSADNNSVSKPESFPDTTVGMLSETAQALSFQRHTLVQNILSAHSHYSPSPDSILNEIWLTHIYSSYKCMSMQF